MIFANWNSYKFVSTLKGSLSKGDRIQLWKVGSLLANNVTLNLPDLPEGLYWDTSDLLKAEGVLRVVEQPTGIVLMSDFSSQQSDVWYSINGCKLSGKPSQKGIYIKNGKIVILK